MFLNESEEYSHGPFFTMEIVELRSLFILEFLHFAIKLLVGEIYD